jgi:hypothetical protein
MFRRHTRSEELALELTLARYLELRVQELEDQTQQNVANRQRGEVRSDVGRMVGWLLLLGGYAAFLGAVSQSLLIGSLLNPQELAQNATAVLTGVGQVTSAVPEALRGLLLSAISTIVLLVLRTASYSFRADIGGSLYVGVTVLALLAFSAAASAGVLSTLVAVPGLLAVGFLIFEFSVVLRRVRRSDVPDDATVKQAANPSRLLGQTSDLLGALLRAIAPARSPRVAVVFVALPLLCLVIEGASFFTNGGPLFWPTLFSYIALFVWSTWAFGVTPAEVRIPLWSIVVWAALFLTQLGDTAVTRVFAPAVVAVLLVNVAAVTVRTPGRKRQDQAAYFPKKRIG